jgi:hypothetical protein
MCPQQGYLGIINVYIVYLYFQQVVIYNGATSAGDDDKQSENSPLVSYSTLGPDALDNWA